MSCARTAPNCRGWRQRVQTLDRDLAKANKALSKSKKAQEVEALLGETRMLQGKLQSQEDDFPSAEQHLATGAGQALCPDRGPGGGKTGGCRRGGAGGAPRDPPRDPPKLGPAPPGWGSGAGGGPPKAELAQLQEEVAKLTEELQEQRER
ncbi:uncharacterized protein LOC129134225 [Agelaius phoeniceus]|uniref:uncharacterized protein LOC129134225 n=1 Tax=Agelaius phoeniceus TaxID=39638 RepID=UPI004054E829